MSYVEHILLRQLVYIIAIHIMLRNRIELNISVLFGMYLIQ